MFPSPAADPGLLVFSTPGTSPASEAAMHTALAAIGAADPQLRDTSKVRIATWGALARNANVFVLTRGARRRDHDLSPADVEQLMSASVRADMSTVLAPFAAARVAPDGSMSVVTDLLGARHIYSVVADGWCAASTSPHALASMSGADVDRQAVAVQSLLGWQLGTRTLYAGVTKLDRASLLTIADGRISVSDYEPHEAVRPLTLDDAVQDASTMLRGYMEAYLDEHPDAVLQLTGGQDSRILLSAISPARRRGLAAMTLSVPGSEDVAIAAALAQRCGLEHLVVTLDGLEQLEPSNAFDRCVSASRRLGCMADPLAFASLAFAEAKFDQRPRISGLGGEVARGFYYFGPPISWPVTRRATALLANWRMFANEAVVSDVLEPEFESWAREFTIDQIHETLVASGSSWMEATDDFYLRQRMQRWAGVTDTAVCFEREVVNPMLDDRFLDVARRLAPQHKRNARFLSRLQLALDADLGAIPLDGRPPPAAFARRSARSSVQLSALLAKKIARKARQRISSTHKPPAGGEILAAKVVQHWREHPELLQPLDRLGVVRRQWLDDVVAGSVLPEPGSVALVINLLVAEHDRRPL